MKLLKLPVKVLINNKKKYGYLTNHSKVSADGLIVLLINDNEIGFDESIKSSSNGLEAVDIYINVKYDNWRIEPLEPSKEAEIIFIEFWKEDSEKYFNFCRKCWHPWRESGFDKCPRCGEKNWHTWRTL